MDSSGECDSAGSGSGGVLCDVFDRVFGFLEYRFLHVGPLVGRGVFGFIRQLGDMASWGG